MSHFSVQKVHFFGGNHRRIEGKFNDSPINIPTVLITGTVQEEISETARNARKSRNTNTINTINTINIRNTEIPEKLEKLEVPEISGIP